MVTFDASISETRVDGELLIATIVRAFEPVASHREADLELPGTKTLSPREREVVSHLLKGRRSKEIALLLDVSEKTIGTHRSRAFQKAGAARRGGSVPRRGGTWIDLILLSQERQLESLSVRLPDLPGWRHEELSSLGTALPVRHAQERAAEA